MSSGDTLRLAEHAYRAADDGIGARALMWMRQTYCGLHGHDCLMHFEKNRMSLQCASCGHATPGWELTEPRPIVSVRAEPRAQVFHRPRLVSARRIA
jgi:hypothetical protein